VKVPPAEGSPISVYAHWPFCARICPYCDFNVARDRPRDEGRWRDAFLLQLERLALLAPERSLSTLYFGGGTPSLAPPETINAIITAARQLWPRPGAIEITLEANPTDAEAARFEAFAAAGVNRLSLGLQSLDDAALAFLKRNHDAAAGVRATQLALQLFPRVSIDLIYARPDLGGDQWADELSRAIALGAGHLSPYQLTIEPGTAFARAVDKKRWRPADEEAAARQFDLTQEITAREGLPAYEISNHARAGEEARHNLVYWRQGEYLGVGPGAHGRVHISGGRVATLGALDPKSWLAAIEAGYDGLAEREPLDREAIMIEKFMMGLRTTEGVVMSAAEQVRLSSRIAALQTDDLLQRADERLFATADGRRLLDHVLARLLA
jgi:oxygen-independent coproporphyrinogen-3 oxidase